MNKFVKLMDAPGDGLWHGNILRLKAKWPYENVVDFMVFDTLDAERPSGLIVTSGHKAGLILVHFPVICCNDNGRGVRKKWLIDNWDLWVYPDCSVDKVMFSTGYVVGEKN
ncbi:Imm45 family immunity protein [Achromobacter sp. NCFB-sbj8-Ac1-l]|jgi:hypothetical protein|uniref:Imm45 family immunity protein n=1 Tax=unclassified Achromobacter TaxID=2626865 RepID=UPI004046AD67